MTRYNKFILLLDKVEKKFGRGDSKNWINRDFEALSFEIRRTTKINISALTLKRIFGKIKTTEEYLPQKATIEALEIYASTGAKSEQINALTAENQHQHEDSIGSTRPIARKHKPQFMIGLGLLLITAFILFISLPKHDSTKAHLKLIKTEGFNPKTAFFEYDTPNDKDSFKILFDEAYPPLFVHNGTSKKINYYFQYPGLFQVRMVSGQTVVSDSVPVFVPTDGWQSSGHYFDQKYNERFYAISMSKCCKNGIFHPTRQVLALSGMDTAKIAVVRLDNFRKTNADGDFFTLNTTIMNPDQWSGVRCNSVYLYIEGTTGKIRFRFANPGCSYWIDYKLSEKEKNNRDEDLSKFTLNLNDWQNFRLENRNKSINLFINNNKVFSNTYVKSIGQLVGVTVLFHGNGYLKNYSLTDKNGLDIFKLNP